MSSAKDSLQVGQQPIAAEGDILFKGAGRGVIVGRFHLEDNLAAFGSNYTDIRQSVGADGNFQ